ncbi:MAG: S8 family serine peptidase [Acidimicrobiia bacterium]
MSRDEDLPEDLVKRDDEVREHQFELLKHYGVQRARDVKDTDGIPVPGGRTVIPVRVVGDDDRASFVAADRVLIPNERAERAVELVKRSIDLGKVERGELVVKPVRGTSYTEVRATGLALPQELNDELLADDIDGRSNHFVFAAYKFKVKEGEDPEDGEMPSIRAAHQDLGCHARVAILDTGYAWQARHDPWLADIAPSVASRDIDLLRISGDPADPLDFGAGHGTFIAGIVRQLAPAAHIDIIRVLDSNGVGLESEIAKGLDRACELGADIILCAFGGYSTGDIGPAAIETAIANVPKNTVVIAAAGNERQSKRPIWPASCRGVEAIAAVDSASDGSMRIVQGEASLAWYTNDGPEVVYAASGTWQSSFVEGEESAARDPDGKPETFTNAATAGGTSFAAAAVAGAVAAALGEGDTGCEAWDRVREHTYAIAGSELRAIDAWNRPER